jgi:carbonic anhydrase
LSSSSPEAAKKLEEAISALEKTYLSDAAPVDPIARLGKGFQTFKTNVYE